MLVESGVSPIHYADGLTPKYGGDKCRTGLRKVHLSNWGSASQTRKDDRWVSRNPRRQDVKQDIAAMRIRRKRYENATLLRPDQGETGRSMRARFCRVALRKQLAYARQMPIANGRMNGLDFSGTTRSRRPRPEVSAQRGNKRPLPSASKPPGRCGHAIRPYICHQPIQRLTVFVIHNANQRFHATLLLDVNTYCEFIQYYASAQGKFGLAASRRRSCAPGSVAAPAPLRHVRCRTTRLLRWSRPDSTRIPGRGRSVGQMPAWLTRFISSPALSLRSLYRSTR